MLNKENKHRCSKVIDIYPREHQLVILMEELAELGNSSLSYNYPNPWDAPVELLEETHRRGVRYCLRAGDKLPNIKKMVELKVDYIPTNCIAPWY